MKRTTEAMLRFQEKFFFGMSIASLLATIVFVILGKGWLEFMVVASLMLNLYCMTLIAQLQPKPKEAQ